MSTDEPRTSHAAQLRRRTFLKAAALGTAMAALVNYQGDELQLGPLQTLANDLSELPCTAQDVTVDPTANIINVPCACTGSTFDAQVNFVVHNHTGTDRYCVTLHIPGGFGVPAQDVVLGDIGPDQTKTLTGTIKGVPCNLDRTLCLGAPGTDGRGKCDAGQCLTVAWNTSPNAPCPDETPPGGQCRHQVICIQGYGATLKCIDNCTPECGQTVKLEACAVAPASRGPFSFQLTGSDGTNLSAGPLAGEADGTTCTTFSVVINASGTVTYDLTVKDKDGCVRTASTQVTAKALPKPSFTITGPDCGGKVTLTVTSPVDGITYTWFDGATSIGTGKELTVTLAAGDHSITVVASRGTGCTTTSDAVKISVAKPLSITAKGSVDCAGKATLTATVDGGTPSYTIKWFEGTTEVGSGTSITIALASGATRTFRAEVTDSKGCTAKSADVKLSFSQLTVKAAVTAGPVCTTGLTTLTATASGGTGPYTFAWFDGATPIGTTNPLTLNLSVGPHSITVKVTDSKGCTATSAPLAIDVPGCPGVCTRTLGYWKTHSKYGPARRDSGWDKITPSGEDSPFFDTGKSWYQILWTTPVGNAYIILAHQYIAATLNVLNGADPTAIAGTLATAKTLLDQYDTNQGAITGALRDQFISLANTLDKYNNGLIGPGHCP